MNECREAFEKWARGIVGLRFHLEQINGDYLYYSTNDSWKAWQAAWNDKDGLANAWKDEDVNHLLVMAYMAGWGDRDQDVVGRIGENGFRKVAGQRADIAVRDRSSDIYT